MTLVRAALAAFSVCLAAAPVSAAPACHSPTAEALGREVATHFQARTIAELARRLPNRPVTLTIEHSLSERRDRHTTRLAGFDDRILRIGRAAGRSEPHGRNVLEPMACAGRVCRFGPSSILHNQLFLKEITVTMVRGCLTVSRVHLLDGD